MPKKIQLNIPKPCHEDWDSMTPVDKGKFCGSCQKQVIDFSSMSDRQVAEFFRKPVFSSSKDGYVCGRFRTDQLDRDLEIPKKRLPWLRYFFTIALPAFFVSLKATGSKTQGQPIVRKVNTDTTGKKIYDDVKMMGMVARPQSIRPFVKDTARQPLNKPVCDKPTSVLPAAEILKGEIMKVTPKEERPPQLNLSQALAGRVGGLTIQRVDDRVVWGVVVNENSEPVSFANIEMPGKKMIVADENGYFEITGRKARKLKQLVVTAAGYQGLEYKPGDATDATGREYIQLKAKADLPEVILTNTVCSIKRAYMMGAAVTGIRVTAIAEKEPSTSNDKDIRVYPNPAISGSGLNIVWKQSEEGYYALQILNLSGQSVFQKEIWIDTEARLLNINLPVLPAASYFLVITQKRSGKRFEERLIIQ